MPVAGVAALLEYAGVAAETAAIAAEVIVAVGAVALSVEMSEIQQRKARDAYNASLQDRYVMSRGAADPRQMVLGRQRVSGPMFYVGSYGPNDQNLVFTVALAGHEIDAVEAIYFDDEEVSIDAGGNVTGVNRKNQFSITTATANYFLTDVPIASTLSAKVDYGSVITPLAVSLTGDSTGRQIHVTGGDPALLGEVTVTYQPNPSPYTPANQLIGTDVITLDAGGNGTYTAEPSGGSLFILTAANVSKTITQSNGTTTTLDLTNYVTINAEGTVATVTGAKDSSGAFVTGECDISLIFNGVASYAKVRWHLGESGQVADAGMISELAGVWTSAHVANNVAYLVCEFVYNPNAFPSGIPNVSAQIRGAKVYDPRSGTTAWSENPALLMRAAATHPLCGRLDANLMDDDSIITAANVCDVPAVYTLRSLPYTLPIYTAGTVAKSGTKPADVLKDLARAMVGKWTFVDGLFRIKAGSYVTPIQTLDETWLNDAQKISIQPTSNRSDVYNAVTGKFADRLNDFQVLDFPQVTADAYVVQDGVTLPLDTPLNAVTFTGQAQQVVAAAMRDARQGLRITVLCNMRAYPVEVFDTLYVTLDRFGWTNKVFEVYDCEWNVDGGIQLSMKEVDPSAWDLGLTFSSTDPAPNTSLPSPFNVPAVTSLACTSGTSDLLKQADGTIVSRIGVTWAAITDAGVVTNGGVEVRYGPAGTAETAWESVIAKGGQSQVYLTGV